MTRGPRFLSAFGCLAFVAALLTFSPLRAFDHPVMTAFEATHTLAIQDLIVRAAPHDAIAAAEQRHDALSPTDYSHALANVIDNQAGARGRVTADLGFSPIDPHIRA